MRGKCAWLIHADDHLSELSFAILWETNRSPIFKHQKLSRGGFWIPDLIWFWLNHFHARNNAHRVDEEELTLHWSSENSRISGWMGTAPKAAGENTNGIHMGIGNGGQWRWRGFDLLKHTEPAPKRGTKTAHQTPWLSTDNTPRNLCLPTLIPNHLSVNYPNRYQNSSNFLYVVKTHDSLVVDHTLLRL
jgi:hypothetical protein